MMGWLWCLLDTHHWRWFILPDLEPGNGDLRVSHCCVCNKFVGGWRGYTGTYREAMNRRKLESDGST